MFSKGLVAGFRHTQSLKCLQNVRYFSKMVAPPMVYISGEEMTRYTMELILDKWINPHFDTSAWKHYDLSCVSRDSTKDKVLHDAVDAGAQIGAIFKEPTVTPSQLQKEKLNLSQAWGSPNGAMRRGWNGITISRDTIHIKGMDLGYKNIVLFERHAIGGEYSAGFKSVGKGTVKTVFHPENDGEDVVIDQRTLTNELNNIVVYDNPLDNVTDLGHIFFKRCLQHKVVPYVVTKKTVFKWQEGFWQKMKNCFDSHYKEQFLAAGLLERTNGELCHLISDAATMQIIRWTDGGFGMAAHNYDGDMLTDEISQVHRSPGFITSNLTGKSASGSLIKEFEASHGTVSDMWEAHLRGEETSLNPLGMAHALVGAMQHSVTLSPTGSDEKIMAFTNQILECMNVAMVNGKGTRDLVGPLGLTTEAFVDIVAQALHGDMSALEAVSVEKKEDETITPILDEDVDAEAVRELFNKIDTNGNGVIDYDEFKHGILKLGVAPVKAINRKKKRKEEDEAGRWGNK